MLKGGPEKPSPMQLQHQAMEVVANLLQKYPERSTDLGNPDNLNKLTLAYNFYRDQGLADTEIGTHLKGIDFNGPVEIVTMPPPRQLAQWQIPPLGGESPRVGSYWTIPRATTPRSLGINPQGPRFDPNKGRASSRQMMDRTEFTFECPLDTPPIPTLRTTAAPIIDDWTDRNNPRAVYGGAPQHFSRELRNYYKPCDNYKLGKQWTRSPAINTSTEMDPTATLQRCSETSQQAMENVQVKLKSIDLAILRDDSPQLSHLVEESKQACLEADEAAKHAKSVIDLLGDDATLVQKHKANQARYYADLAAKDLKEITSTVDQFNKKENRGDSLSGKKPLPPIARSNETMPPKDASLPNLDGRPRHDALAPLGNSSMSNHRNDTTNNFRDKIDRIKEGSAGKGIENASSAHSRNNNKI